MPVPHISPELVHYFPNFPDRNHKEVLYREVAQAFQLWRKQLNL